MEHGPFEDDSGQALDFQIIHRDIKPANSELKHILSQAFPLNCFALTF